jgi:hypothetical protein
MLFRPIFPGTAADEPLNEAAHAPGCPSAPELSLRLFKQRRRDLLELFAPLI